MDDKTMDDDVDLGANDDIRQTLDERDMTLAVSVFDPREKQRDLPIDLREELESLARSWEKEIKYAEIVMPTSYHSAEWRAKRDALKSCAAQLRELLK